MKYLKNILVGLTFFTFISFVGIISVQAEGGTVTTIDCGANIIGIPVETAKIMRTAYLLIKILVPVVLVFTGMFDFARAVMGSSEDDVKKKQAKFVKRLIAAVVVFLVMAIVELVFSLLAKAGFADATACINAILNGDF